MVRETASGRERSGPAKPSVFRDAILAGLEGESRLKREEKETTNREGINSGVLRLLGLESRPYGWSEYGEK